LKLFLDNKINFIIIRPMFHVLRDKFEEIICALWFRQDHGGSDPAYPPVQGNEKDGPESASK
jgi:hypothetical protein